jgi:type II secretory pathway component PulJ
MLKYQSGLSLIEVLVSMALGILLLGALGSFMITNLSTQANHARSANLAQSMNSAIDLITKELRRSRYYAGSKFISTAELANTSTLTYSFPGGYTDAQKRSINTTLFKISRPSNSCVLYSYNTDLNFEASPNNAIDKVDTYDQLGFKLASGKLQFRSACTGSTCMSSCSTGTWVDLTSTSVMNIDSFLICFYNRGSEPPNLNGSNEPGTETCNSSGDSALIYLRASDPKDASLSRTLKSTINFRNQ